jgi:putative ABC transport system permease protein
MMLCNIAFQNVKKSLRDYSVYFLTLTLGVCIFYIFNSIESQQAVMDLNAGQSSALQALSRIVSVFSTFISVILAFLIMYANSFLIKRRKKEFGIYLILGMEKGRISRILILEAVWVGLISLVTGLALGALFSQGMAVVTAKLMGVGLKSLRFIFSLTALRGTAAYFGLTFLLALIFNVIMVRRQKLIDLIYADRKNESFQTPRLVLSVAIFLTSLVCLGGAYGLITAPGALFQQSVFALSVVLGVLGTFLFFWSLSGFFLKLFQQRKTLYLKNLNMFVLRQINSKINTAYVSMTFVCLMLFVSICTLSSGIGIANALADELSRSAPFDATIAVYAPGADDAARGETSNGEAKGGGTPAYAGLDLQAALRAQAGDGAFIEEALQSSYYEGGVTLPLTLPDTGEGEESVVNVPTRFMKLSDYNALLAMQGIDAISLPAGMYAVNFDQTNQWPAVLRSYLAGDNRITLFGTDLRSDSALFYQYAMETAENWRYVVSIVVADALLEGAPVAADMLHINYPEASDAYESMCLSAYKKLAVQDGDGTQGGKTIETKAVIMQKSNSATATIAYLAVYLGIVFLLASATVLSIAQLSETSDNMRRYGLLRKIGTEDRMINGALFAQIAVYFGVPLALALVHSAVGVSVAGQVVGALGEMDIVGTSLFTSAVILLVYGGYFLATYWGGKNMLAKEYMQKRGRA